ncbi:hypothetical protein [Streptomyces sp. NPDC001165]
MTGALTLVYAREPIPVSGPEVSLAGPTPQARSAVRALPEA